MQNIQIRKGSGDPIYLSPGVTHRSQKVKRNKQEPPALGRSGFLVNSKQRACGAKTFQSHMEMMLVYWAGWECQGPGEGVTGEHRSATK